MCVGSDLAGEHDVLPVVAVAVVDPLGLVVALLYPGLAARARPRLVEVYPYRPGARPLHVPGALGGPPAPTSALEWPSRRQNMSASPWTQKKAII